ALDLRKPIVGTVFPNFSMLRPTSRTFRVWHPRGPERTEVWAWVFADRAAPQKVKEAIGLARARRCGPALTAQLRNGPRARALRRGSRSIGQRLPLQRKQPSWVLPALGAADGGRRLGRNSRQWIRRGVWGTILLI